MREILQFGHAGVDFFFVISGFIILYVHYDDIGNSGRLIRYGNRRFTRLFPTYWIAMTISFLLACLGRQQAPEIADLLWSITLLPSDHRLVLGIAWTLQYEIMFYALFATLIFNRMAGLIVMTIWVSIILLTFLGQSELSGVPAQFSAAYNLEFFLGMAVALTLKTRTIHRPLLVLVVGLLLFGVTAFLEDIGFLNGYGDIARVAYGVPPAILVLGVAASDRQSLLRVPRFIGAIGSASYSIYLFHFIFVAMAWQILSYLGLEHRTPAMISFFLLTTTAIGGGTIVSRGVEYPLIDKFRMRRPYRPPVTAT